MLNPKYPYAFNNLGTVYFAQDDKRNAEKCFRKAITLNPGIASFYINLGTLYFEWKRPEKGMAALHKALEIDPDVLTKPDTISLAAGGSLNPSERAYLHAKVYASIGDAERSVQHLQIALNAGFTNIEALRTDKDFDPIREDERFVSFLKTAALLVK